MSNKDYEIFTPEETVLYATAAKLTKHLQNKPIINFSTANVEDILHTKGNYQTPSGIWYAETWEEKGKDSSFQIAVIELSVQGAPLKLKEIPQEITTIKLAFTKRQNSLDNTSSHALSMTAATTPDINHVFTNYSFTHTINTMGGEIGRCEAGKPDSFTKHLELHEALSILDQLIVTIG